MKSWFKENYDVLRVLRPEVLLAIQHIPEMTDAKVKDHGDGVRVEMNDAVWYPSAPSIPQAVEAKTDGAKRMRPPGKYFLVGFGLGYIAEALSRKLHPDIELIIWEHDLHLFRLALQVRDLRPIFKRPKIQIQLGPVEPALERLIAGTTTTMSNITILIDDDLKACDPQYQKAIDQKVLPVARTHQVNQVTLKKFARSFLVNGLKNTSLLHEADSCGSLTGLGLGVPAILIGSGPSLERNYRHLKKAKGKAILIAADSALKGLLLHDIIPDLVVTVDPQSATLVKMKNVKKVPAKRQPFLVFHPVCNHDVARLPYPKIVVGAGGPFWEIFATLMPNAVKLDENIHCQMHLAANVAEYMGCQPIILSGMDLAFTDGLYSEKSCAYLDDAQTESVVNRGETELADGVNGPVKTSALFRDYAFLFSLRAKKHGVYFNGTEAGQVIENIPNQPLGQLVEAMGSGLKIDFRERFSENPRRFPKLAVSPLRGRLVEIQQDYVNIIAQCAGLDQCSHEERIARIKILRDRKVGLHTLFGLSSNREHITPCDWPLTAEEDYPYHLNRIEGEAKAKAYYVWLQQVALEMESVVSSSIERL